MMHDVVLPGLDPLTTQTKCPDRHCLAQLPLGAEDHLLHWHKYGATEMTKWRAALQGDPGSVQQFKRNYRDAEPAAGHGEECKLGDLPVPVLVQAADQTEALRWLQEMYDAPGYKPRPVGDQG